MPAVVVSGAIANRYLKAGEAWHRLHWVLGLQRLGHTVHFVEQIARASCVDDSGTPAEFQSSVNLAYLRSIVDEFGLTGRAALVCEDGEETWGLSFRELRDVAKSADLLINISGHLTLPTLTTPVRTRVYIDEDPGFTQFWHAAGNTGLRLDGHDYYFTIGENIGTPECPIPSTGVPWRQTRPIVVLDQWPVVYQRQPTRFTTVAGWRGPYGPVDHQGQRYGLKVHQFRRFIELPRQVACPFELALDIDPADGKDLDLLRQHGWQVVEPSSVVPDPASFRRYIQASGAEFSVAKGVYVETNSGWFSDRTVRYLASGKPALVQETGFSRNYPTGEGLVPFRTLDEAVAGAERIARDYDAHAQAARALAAEFFDSDKVLSRLLDEVGVRG